jgi:hypothetical protein
MVSQYHYRPTVCWGSLDRGSNVIGVVVSGGSHDRGNRGLADREFADFNLLQHT